MDKKTTITIIVILFVLVVGIGMTVSNNKGVSPSPQAPQNLTPTVAMGAHSGEAVIAEVMIEEGSGAQIIYMPTLGRFAVTDETLIYDINGKQTDFEYLQKGQLVVVDGRPGEGVSIIGTIRVLKNNQPIPNSPTPVAPAL